MTLMLRANALTTEARSRAEAARFLYAKACYLLALATVCRVLDVRMADALGPAQTRTPAARARTLAVYMAVTNFNLPRAQVARAAAITRQVAARACHGVEDRRDDQAFDHLLTGIEQRLKEAA